MIDLSTLIPWVLERIVNDEYDVSRDSEGKINSVDFNPFYGEQKKRFEVIEYGLLASMPEEKREALLSLKDGYTRESLTAAMATTYSFNKLGPPGTELAAWMAERLDGATWEEIVRYIAYMHTAVWEGEGKWEGIGPKLARTREGFGTASDAYLEQQIQSTQPESLRMHREKKYARDLIKLFPKIVKRADSDLPRLLKQSVEPSDLVKRYLNEAMRCYIYGQFLASLLVCRAAIEASLEDRLPATEVQNIREDKLMTLIDRAWKKGLLDDALQEWAHEVRKLANDAAHPGRLVREDECKLSLQKTRGILEHLYLSQRPSRTEF